MRTFIYLGAVFFASFALGPTGRAAPQPIDDGKSPDGLFEVLIDCDKDSPEFQKRYAMAGGDEDFPALLIRRVENGKTLRRIPWPGDPQSDGQPLRDHTKISWNSRSRAVVVCTDERCYSYTELFCYNGKTGAFDSLKLPSYREMTGFPPPAQKDLRPRGHSWISGWTKEGNLIYYMNLSPAGGYKGEDTMYHRVILSLAAGKTKVVSRKMLSRGD